MGLQSKQVMKLTIPEI